MLWVCLQFPELPLDAVRPEGCAREAAAVLIDGHVRSPRIVIANTAARASGVRSGQSLAAARALQPGLFAWRRDPAAEHQMLITFADWAYRFSAEVSLAPPRALLIEVGASLRLFEGWKTLQRRLRGDLESFGCAYRMVAAPVAAGARVLASCADGIALGNVPQMIQALGEISVSNCGLEKTTSSTLSASGLRRLKQVFSLPRAELGRRIGPAALLHLDRMRGLVAEARITHHPAARYARRLEFDYRIDTVQGLLFPLQRMLRELGIFLIARDGGVQRFELIFEHEREATTRIAVGLLAAQRDPAILLELARTRLERVALVAPVHAMSVIAADLPAMRPVHADLFETNARETLSWPALVERLRARLGDEAVHGLATVADHRPAYSWRRQVLGGEPANTISVTSKHAVVQKTQYGKSLMPAIASGRRPLWLLGTPIPLRQPPWRVLSGPERIESGWWDADQRHDYYVVQTLEGQQAWAYVATGATANWMLQGWFA